jgi:hypothetical protein
MLPHLWETDDRDPLLTFFLPSSMVGQEYEGTYGFYMLSVPFWIELLLVSVVLYCIFALHVLHCLTCPAASHHDVFIISLRSMPCHVLSYRVLPCHAIRLSFWKY